MSIPTVINAAAITMFHKRVKKPDAAKPNTPEKLKFDAAESAMPSPIIAVTARYAPSAISTIPPSQP